MVAALTGDVVSNAVNIPAIPPEDWGAVGPYLPLCEQLGRIGAALAEGGSIDRVEVEFLGRLAERDNRLLTIAVLNGVLAGPPRRRSTTSTPRRWPRSAASSSPRPRSRSRATSPTSSA